jgi:hypothetical protein
MMHLQENDSVPGCTYGDNEDLEEAYWLERE